MPRVNIPVVSPSRSGVAFHTQVTGVPADDHTVVNNGKVYIFVENTSADTAYPVEFVRKRTVDEGVPEVRSETVAFQTEEVYGPFPTADYGTALDINVTNAALKIRALGV